MGALSNKVISDSRKQALRKIIEILDKGDIEGQFADRTGDYHSKDKFIVTWNGNWNGIPSEYKVEKCDAFYTAYSGYKAVYGTAGLFHEKMFKGYPSIEMALLDVGLKLCPNKKEMKMFWDKYVQPYIERVKKAKDGTT